MNHGKLNVAVFPIQLKKARQFRGYKTQVACCKKINIRKQAWSLWERGRRVPTVAQLIQLTYLFELDIHYFLLEGAEPEDYVVDQ